MNMLGVIGIAGIIASSVVLELTSVNTRRRVLLMIMVGYMISVFILVIVALNLMFNYFYGFGRQ